MKVRKILLLVIIAIGVTTLMSTTCDKEDTDPATCEGIISAAASGNINENFCFTTLVTYDFTANESATLNARQVGTPEYALGIYLYENTGSGTYNCGSDQPCFIELIIHGDDNEFYKSQSGTITITQIDNSNFKATFNIVTVGYYNEKTVNITGTANFTGIVKK